MKCKVGVLVPVCAQAHKQQAQAAKNQMGKCGARYLCASGQGGSRPEPQPAVTVQLYIRYLDWRLYHPSRLQALTGKRIQRAVLHKSAQ